MLPRTFINRSNRLLSTIFLWDAVSLLWR